MFRLCEVHVIGKKNTKIELPVIFNKFTRDTYISFIKSNFELIDELVGKFNKITHYGDKDFFYARANHLQIMSLIGITSEAVLKAVLLKHGYIINSKFKDKKKKSKIAYKFPDDILNELNSRDKNVEYAENNILEKATSFLKTNNFDLSKTITIADCAKVFIKEIIDSKKYFLDFPKYESKGSDDILSKKLEQAYPRAVFNMLCELRNSYMHLASARDELMNLRPFLIAVLKKIVEKEFNKNF